MATPTVQVMDREALEIYTFDTATPAPSATAEEKAVAVLPAEAESTPVPTATASATATPIPLPTSMLYGVFDPEGQHERNWAISVQHEYISWLELPERSHEVASNALKMGRIPLIALMPYPWEGSEFHAEWIVQGLYDPHIKGHCQALNMPGQPVLMRWAHEMDLPSNHGLFPWSGQDPREMIAAQRHFTDLCRESAPNVMFVWSPAGEPALLDYYPGDEYVDFVGLTTLWNQLISHRESPEGAFADLFTPRYQRVEGFGKPILIAEFGVAAEPKFAQAYLREAYESVDEYPLLRGLILFNFHQKDNAWGEGIHPDFRVGAEYFPTHSKN